MGAYPEAARARIWYHCRGAADSTSLSASLHPPLSATIRPTPTPTHPPPKKRSYVTTSLPSSHLAGQMQRFIIRDPPLGIAPYADAHACLSRQLFKQLQSQRESNKTLQRPLFSKRGEGRNCSLVERQHLHLEESPGAQTSWACMIACIWA